MAEEPHNATIVLLDGVTLTATFADNESDPVQIAPFIQTELVLDYTMDATETGNSVVVKVLLSEDGDNYHEYSIVSDQTPSGGVVKAILYPRRFQITGTAGTKETRWAALPTGARWMKIQAMEEGLASVGGVATISVRISNNEGCD